MTGIEPTRLLIAAMGGEGGGVLAGWITQAALDAGLWVQRTSVPGVAQRTGATTYYLEFLPRAAGGQQPVMALNPSPGRVDVLVATELLEAARMVQAGYVTPERTYLIGSTHRVFTVDEKSAMADGRLDDAPLVAHCRSSARAAVLEDLGAIAAAQGCHLNAVLLGAIVASGVLPVGAEHCRAAIRAGDRAVGANLRGFEAGLAQMWAGDTPRDFPAADAGPIPAVAGADTSFLPGAAATLADEGVRRLTDYQNTRYGETYLAHLRELAAHPEASEAVLAAVARHLAIRMSYEDTFRVAQLKLRESRLDKVRGEARARPGAIIDVIEYLKPGPEEIFGMFPPRLGAWLMRVCERRGWDGRSFPMKVRTTRFSGFIRLRALSALRHWRPRSLRHAQEMAWITQWLDRICRALDHDQRAANEIAESARLVRGYGTTLKRGLRNWNLILSRIIDPGLANGFDTAQLADAVLQARLAALKDPDGTALEDMIRAFEAAIGRDRASDGATQVA